MQYSKELWPEMGSVTVSREFWNYVDSVNTILATAHQFNLRYVAVLWLVIVALCVTIFVLICIKHKSQPAESQGDGQALRTTAVRENSDATST